METPNVRQGPQCGWDVFAERQARVWLETARLNAAMNELAALGFNHRHWWANIILTVLTVVVGAKGVANLAEAVTWLDVVVGIAEVTLGIVAGLVSNLEWKAKGRAHNKRAIGYTKLAANIRIQLTLNMDERIPKVEFFQSVPERVEQLDELADPLPLTFREKAEQTAGIISMWGATGIPKNNLDDLEQGMGHSGRYDPSLDAEGDPTAFARDVQLLLRQHL